MLFIELADGAIVNAADIAVIRRSNKEVYLFLGQTIANEEPLVEAYTSETGAEMRVQSLKTMCGALDFPEALAAHVAVDEVEDE